MLNKAKQSVAIQKTSETIDLAKSLVESGEQVVIVTGYTEVVNKVRSAFKSSAAIVGGMSDTAKQSAIDSFQSGLVDVIVLNYTAGGVGITLTAAHYMILNDLPWVPGEVEQAEGRIWRSGQTETAMIYTMVADNCPMDEFLVKTVVAKSESISDAIDGSTGDTLHQLAEHLIQLSED